MQADINSILIYSSALTVTLLLLRHCTKSKTTSWFKRFFEILIAAIPLSLLAGLKAPTVGTDSFNYMMIFHSIYNSSFLDCVFQPSVEAGFALLVKTLSILVGEDDSMIFFTLEFLSLTIFICAILELKDKANSCLIFFLYFLMFYHSSLNIIRQGLAISLIAFMIIKLMEKKYFKATLILIVSVSIHLSSSIAIIFVLAAVLLKNYVYLSKKRFLYFCILFLVFIAFYFGWNSMASFPIFSSYSGYVSGSHDIGVGVFVTGFAYFTFPLLLCRHQIFNEYETEVLFDISVMFVPIAFLGYFAEYAARLNLFPRIAIILFIPHLLYKVKNSNNRRFMLCFYIGWFMLDYIENFLIHNQTNAYPYLFNL